MIREMKNSLFRNLLPSSNYLTNFGISNHQKYNIFSRALKTSNPFLSNFYTILGVSKNASQSDIKKAYFKKVKEYHPDVNKSPDATEKFREIQEAYDCLSHPQKKQHYDMTGSTSSGPYTDSYQSHNDQRKPSYQSQANRQNQAEFDFDDVFSQNFFNDIFGTYASKQKFQVQMPISLTFQESIIGCSKKIDVNIVKACPSCNGTTLNPGASYITCPACQGGGFKARRHGNMVIQTACDKCFGTGKINPSPCKVCKGSGKSHSVSPVNINIPPGTENGSTFRLSDDNNDIFVTIKVIPSKVFRKEGNDIHSDIHIDFLKAIMGGIAKGETVFGKYDIKIPKGINSHHKIVIPGKGVPSRTFSGDHIFHVNIVIPKKLTPEQLEILKKLQDSMGEDMQNAVNSASKNNSKETIG